MSEQQILRPQPVGVFPFPMGLLLLPETTPRASAVLEALMVGERGMTAPPEWGFYVQALAGETDRSAAEALAEGSLLGIYNAFVLTGELALYERLRQEARGELSVLAALVAYAHGLADTLPGEEQLGMLNGELLAVARMIQAAHLLEVGETHLAKRLLLSSADEIKELSPIFAAQLCGQVAQMAEGYESMALYRRAAALLESCRDTRLKAETWIALGQSCQEAASLGVVPDRSLLVEATKAYQCAIALGLSEDCHRDLFALAQNNLGLAYLAMPMDGDGARLRTAIAVQSFREALKVYDRERTPEAWVSTQLNLANALQYAHSAHPEENLARAVEIYEELLEARPRGIDPLGHARLLANQANALAHLGIFAPALVKATEAHKLLHWHGEPKLAESMLVLTEEINQRLAGSLAEVTR